MKALIISAIFALSPIITFSQVAPECSNYIKAFEDKFEGITRLESKPTKLANKLGEVVTVRFQYWFFIEQGEMETYLMVNFPQWRCPNTGAKFYILKKDGKRIILTAHKTDCAGNVTFKLDRHGEDFMRAMIHDEVTDIAISGPNTRYIFTDYELLKKNTRMFGECLLEYMNN